MKTLKVNQMERVQGGLPRWASCTGAAIGTVLLFSSIFAGNIGAMLYGPTAVGIAWGSCGGAARVQSKGRSSRYAVAA